MIAAPRSRWPTVASSVADDHVTPSSVEMTTALRASLAPGS